MVTVATRFAVSDYLLSVSWPSLAPFVRRYQVSAELPVESPKKAFSLPAFSSSLTDYVELILFSISPKRRSKFIRLDQLASELEQT